MAKVAVSIPAELLRLARREVAVGRAKSLSAFVSEAVDEKLRRDELRAILDAMDAEHGKPYNFTVRPVPRLSCVRQNRRISKEKGDGS